MTILSTTCEYDEIPYSETRTMMAAVNIQVPSYDFDSHFEKPPLSLVAVIDVSGSMCGTRIELAKKTLSLVVNQLQSRDYFGIVTFGSYSRIILSLQRMSTTNKREALRTISSIRIDGCTALSSGLFNGLRCLEDSPASHTSCVMLLTDGHANTGLTTTQTILPELEKRKSKLKNEVSIFTFGYGTDHNASFLRAISDSAQGMYYFIERTNQIQAAFAECLGGVTSVAFCSVSIHLETENGVRIVDILADVPQERRRNTTILSLGNLSSAEQKNIPLRLAFDKVDQVLSKRKQLLCVLLYETCEGSQREECELVISRPRLEDCSHQKSSNFIEIDEQCNRVKLAETLKEVISLGERRELEVAKSKLQRLHQELQHSASYHTTFTKNLIEDIRASIDSLSDYNTFHTIGSKFLYSLSRSHYQQRASGISSTAAAAYLTDGQRNMLQTILGPNQTQNNSVTSQTSHQTKQETPVVSEGRLGRGVRRLMSDLAEIKNHPLPSVTAEPLESDVFEWHCNMEGPSGNSYHQIVFHIIMQFPHTYPFQPPKLFFCSYLNHQHVFRTWICLDMLQEFEWSANSETDTPYTGWTSAYSVHSVLLQLQSFLFDKANLSQIEVQKAKESAASFTCKTCSHNGSDPAMYWPKLSPNVCESNPLSSIDIPLAKVQVPVFEPKALPSLSTKKPKRKKTRAPLICTMQPVIDKEQEEEWVEVPVKKPKKSKKSPSKWNKPMKMRREETVELVESSEVESDDEEEEEETGKLTAAQKKNAKRRRKLKRLREEKRKAEQKRLALEREQKAKEAEQQRLAAEQQRKQELETISQKQIENNPMAKLLFESKGDGVEQSLFSFLPREVIQHVFSFLPVCDLVRISKCCRLFYQIGNDNELWKSFCTRYFPTSSIESTFHPKIRFGQEVLATKAQLFCFHTRKSFEEDVLGIPISFDRNPRTKLIQYISSTLDLLSEEGFSDDHVRKSVWKRPFTNWIPLYINEEHADRAWPSITKSMAKLCDAKIFHPWMALDVLSKLMSTMVVSVMSGETHASIVAIEGYCAFHHLLLKMIERYPELLTRVESAIGMFIKEERNRSKEVTPSLGEFITYLAVSNKYHWNDVRSAYLQESFDRNALWAIKQHPSLKYVDDNYAQKKHVNTDRLQKTFEATKTSKRLLMFHVYFLSKIARPEGRSLSEVTSNYDLCYGRPTAQMKEDLQNYCKQVLAVTNWPEFFRLIDMKIPSPLFVTFVLNQSVVNSKRKQYHK